jgi:hypothetical protein
MKIVKIKVMKNNENCEVFLLISTLPIRKLINVGEC